MMSKKGVKTRQREKETIRKIDKTAIFHDKLKRTYVKTKDRAGTVSYTHIDVYKRQDSSNRVDFARLWYRADWFVVKIP